MDSFKINEMKIAKYNVKRGEWPFGTLGKAKWFGGKLWLFQADGSDVKLPIEEEYLSFGK